MTPPQHISFCISDAIYKIKFSDIYLFEWEMDYFMVHYRDYKNIMTSAKLKGTTKKMLAHLDERFVRIQKSIIVNSDLVFKIIDSRVYLLGYDKQVTAGKVFKDDLIKRMNVFSLSTVGVEGTDSTNEDDYFPIDKKANTAYKKMIKEYEIKDHPRPDYLKT